MIIYFMLCLITLLAGVGFLRILNVKLEPLFVISLAPVLTLSLWVIFLCLGLKDGFSIRQISGIGWLATLILAVNGYRYKPLWGVVVENSRSVLLIVLLPIAIMLAFFWHGISNYAGSPAQDGWAYIVFGNYLWNHFLGAQNGLNPLGQFAVHLVNTRYASSALLAFFSSAIGAGGDTQLITNIFLGWTLFVFGSTCYFFAATQKLRKFSSLFLILLIFSGWILNLLYVNNFDNQLVLAFIPALAGISYQLQYKSLGWVLISSILLTAILFAYPELSPVILFVAILFLLERILHDKTPFINIVILIGAILLVTLLFTLPYIKSTVIYIWNQFSISAGSTTGRPGGGMFQNLTHAFTLFPAYFGLYSSPCCGLSPPYVGGVMGSNILLIVAYILSFVVTLFSAIGVVISLKRKSFALPLSFVCLFLASLYMLFFKHYSYGAYKLILLNWWSTCFLVTLAVKAFWDKKKALLKISSVILFSLYLLVILLILRQYNSNLPFRTLQPLKQVQNIRNIIGDNQVAVSIRYTPNFNWGLYFLRNAHLKLLSFRGYSSSPTRKIDMMQTAKYENSKSFYLLTDYSNNVIDTRLLWSQPPYYLWKTTKKSTLILDIISPNGLEQWNNKMSFWLGNQEAKVEIYSFVKAKLRFDFSAMPGPSIPDNNVRHLFIKGQDDFGKKILLGSTTKQNIELQIQPGINNIYLKALDTPTLLKQPNGDARIMLVGITDIHMTLLN